MRLLGFLDVNEYEKDKREFRVPRGAVRVGRNPHGDVVLADVAVSRNHARIESSARGFAIEDLESRNGTYVNGAKLGCGEKRVLRDGDEILVGRSVLRLFLSRSRWQQGPGSRSSVVTHAPARHADRHRSERLLRFEALITRLIARKRSWLLRLLRPDDSPTR